MNYFEFLEALKVGDEVLTSTTGGRIFKVIRLNEFLIMLNNGALFDRETGEILPKKEHNTRSLVELTTERRKHIEAKKEEEKDYMDYFIFLDFLEVGNEVLTSITGDRIFKVIGINDNHIMTDGGMLFDRKTGQLVTKNNSNSNTCALVELTDERKRAIQERERERAQKEEERQLKRRIWEEFNSLTGQGCLQKAPSVEIQKKVIKLIKENSA